VLRASSLNGVLTRLLSHQPILHHIAPPVSASAPLPPESELYSKLQARIPGISTKNQQSLIPSMRLVKGPEELERMEKAIANTIAAHRVAARSIEAGVEENWVAGLID